MAARSAAPSLGEFELLVLLSAMSLGDTAYPVSIAADIESRTGRPASRTTVLITLERLEDKGLVSSWYGDPTPVRGGRPKRHFQLKPQGLKAVQQSLDRIDAMTARVRGVLRAK